MRIVLKLGGNVVLDAAQVGIVATETRALRHAGHQVTIVHGGGPQLDKALAALGEPTVKVEGLRVTSLAAAAVVLRVLDGIGLDLARALAGHGLGTFNVPAAQRTFAAHSKRIPQGELGRVGTVDRFTAAATVTSDPTRVAVVTPVGFDATGPLNVNADEGAGAVAAALQAEWLVLATDVAAVRDADGSNLSRLAPADVKRVLARAATGGMIPKLQTALAALEAGVQRVLVTSISAGTLQRAIVAGRPAGTLIAAQVLT